MVRLESWERWGTEELVERGAAVERLECGEAATLALSFRLCEGRKELIPRWMKGRAAGSALSVQGPQEYGLKVTRATGQTERILAPWELGAYFSPLSNIISSLFVIDVSHLSHKRIQRRMVSWCDL